MATGTFSARDISHITKFDGNNFSFWKFQLKLILEHHGLVDIVEGKEPMPKAIDLHSDNSNATEVAARDELIKNWKQKDNASRNFIVSSLDERCQRSLMNCTTSSQMWSRLKTQFELVSQENKHLLMAKFMGYEYGTGNKIMDHITAVETLATQLTDLGSPISEEQIITKIVMTLPSSYRPFLSAWNNVEDNKKTLSLLTLRLQAEENMSKVAELTVSNSSPDAAFWASKGRQKPQRQQNETNDWLGNAKDTAKRGQKKPQCDFCRKANRRSTHSEDKCWVKEAYLQGRREATEEKAALAKSSSLKATTGEDDYAFHSNGLKQPLSPNSWYADSGASQHMTDQMSFFKTFRPIEPNTRAVKGIGKSNKSLYALGIGDVQIKSQVNGIWHNGIINDVLYVPDLGANLFSIGAATERSVKAVFDREGLSLIKNGKTVATGSRLGKGLYLLDIETVNEEKAFISESVLLC